MKKSLVFRYTIMTEDGSEGYWWTEDCAEHFNEIAKLDGEEKALEHYKEHVCRADSKEVIGIMESIEQSDDCPTFIYHTPLAHLIVSVQKIEDEDDEQ